MLHRVLVDFNETSSRRSSREFAAVAPSARTGIRTPDPGIYLRALLDADYVRTRRSPSATQGSPTSRFPVQWALARDSGNGLSATRRIAASRWRTGHGSSRAGRLWWILSTGSAAQLIQYVAGDTVDSGVSFLPNDHGPVGGSRGEDRPVPGVDAHRRRPGSGDNGLSGRAVPVTHPQVIDIFVHRIEHHDAQDQEVFRGAVLAGGSGQAIVVVVKSSAVALVPDQGQASSERVRLATVAITPQSGALVYPVVGVLHDQYSSWPTLSSRRYHRSSPGSMCRSRSVQNSTA